jgi:hypothetical protein
MLTLTLAFGQPAPTPPTSGIPARPIPSPRLPQPPQSPGTFTERLQTIVNREAGSQNPAPALTRFDLDFPGGTPAQLVKAVEKAMDRPLNTIISDEDANVQLPPLKMNHVDVAQLFQALEAASRKDVSVYNQGFGSYSQQTTGYSFRTASGNLSDDSIWYFHVAKPTLPPVISSQRICRFYSLAPYLNRGFTVDDITTAIQTGWKMAGITPPPELNYHKETKLLIAYGEPDRLQTIQSVLETLPASNVTRSEVESMNSEIGQLRDQVNQLKKKSSPAVALPFALPEEKSGK